MIHEAIRRVERGEEQEGCPLCAVARRVREEGLSPEEGERLLAEMLAPPGYLRSGFYGGAERIDAFLDKPRVGRFIDALTMWWLVATAVFVVAALVALVIAVMELA